ncbi:MAG: ATP-binding cassette domain-containing protein [Pseudomonadota bacterium]
MLLLDNLVFQYTPDTPTYRFSLSLAAGDIATVHGLSGSGKSTLLDLIAGFLQPSSGELLWHRESFTGKRPKDRPVTFVFQRNNLFEHRSAIDNVLIGIDPTLKKHGQNYQQAVNALGTVGLSNHVNQRVSTLSGGQQQRVALARASLRNKGILLLDEPFSALDPSTRHDMLLLVQQLAAAQNNAVIMVTHDQRDADAIASHRYRIQQGELQLPTS